MIEQIACLFICFMLYSMAGWLFESVFCSISERRFVNRGFLNGPYCPIYGAGAIAAVLLFSNVEDNTALFFESALVCSVIEYGTSWVMEKMYHTRWWDYSNRQLNLYGRICAPATTLFGLGCLFIVRFVHPAVYGAISSLSYRSINALCTSFALVFATDIVVTNIGLSGFRNKVDAYCNQLTVKAQDFYDNVLEGDNPVGRSFMSLQEGPLGKAYLRLKELAPAPIAVEDIAAAFMGALNFQERRILDAFPKMSFDATPIRDSAAQIRERIRSAQNK